MLKQPVLEGSRFICAQLQVKNLKFELEREEKVVSCFQFACNKVWSITFSWDDLVSSVKRHQHVAQHINQHQQEEEMILWWTELCHSTPLNSLDTLLSQMMRSQIMDSIYSFWHRSVVEVLRIKEEYATLTSNKPSLAPVKKRHNRLHCWLCVSK